ncbi:MAG: hypothetical protein F4Y97_00335 [Dehalococcoidia bacterium]|nr:hypothetical protein [Dehalococcoidia bacterium]
MVDPETVFLGNESVAREPTTLRYRVMHGQAERSSEARNNAVHSHVHWRAFPAPFAPEGLGSGAIYYHGNAGITQATDLARPDTYPLNTRSFLGQVCGRSLVDPDALTADAGEENWLKALLTSNVPGTSSESREATSDVLQSVVDCWSKWEIASRRLGDALEAVHQAQQDAEEDELALPSASSLANATALLPEVYGMCSTPVDVYVTDDAELAIQSIDGRGSGVLILCESAGDILCLVSIGPEQGRRRYSRGDRFPDEFMQKAFLELGRGSQ